MSGYTKLFGSILRSTVWKTPPHVRLVWIAMLALADRDGVVDSSVPGLADAAGVSISECEQALVHFQSPDPYSRTTDHEGRRIEKVDGGWRLLNHAKYQAKLSIEDRRERDRERQARHREAQRASRDGHAASAVSREVTQVTAVTRGHSESDTQTQTQTHLQKNTREARAHAPAHAHAREREATDDDTSRGAIARVLNAFATAWQRKLGDAWPGVGKHRDRLDRIARELVQRPDGEAWLQASIAGFFESDDPFVKRTRWNFGTWSHDPGRYVPTRSEPAADALAMLAGVPQSDTSAPLPQRSLAEDFGLGDLASSQRGDRA